MKMIMFTYEVSLNDWEIEVVVYLLPELDFYETNSIMCLVQLILYFIVKVKC